MKFTKILSALLAAVMLLGVCVIGVNAEEKLPFSDVKEGEWYYDAVADVYEAGLMKGKTDTQFDPSAPMSRAEFVTVLSRLAAINAANYGYADELDFTDTDPDAWYADAAGWAVETGLSTGTSATTFSPTREITRQEMAVLIVRFVKYLGETVPDNSKVDKFADANKIASWATADIEIMRKYGFVQGDQNGNFNPEGKADRASVATIAMRLLPYVTTTDVVENGKSDYVIVADEAAKDAADRLQYQVEYTTGVKLDIVDKSSSKKAIVLKSVDDDKLGTDGYEIKADGDTVTVTGDTSEGIYKGAVRFILRATFDNNVKFTSAANDRYEFKYPIGKLTINGNDIAKYTILYPENASEKTMKGVSELQKYIEMSCGVKLPSKEGTSGEFAIILEEKTVVVEGSANDNIDNFSLKSEGNNIRITGSAERSIIYGCYDLIDDVIGWIYMSDFVGTDRYPHIPGAYEYVSPREALDITGLDYTESSLISERHSSSSDDRGRSSVLKWVGGRCHTFVALGTKPDGTSFSVQHENQPCLTSEEVYEVMLANVLKLLNENPDGDIISISQNDNVGYCQCDNCKASDAKYGGPSGTLVAFLNKMAADMEKAGFGDVLIHTFAYMYTEKAPENIKADSNIMVEFAPINSCFAHTIDRGCNNPAYGSQMKKWAEVCDHIYYWDYLFCYSQHPSPFPYIHYDNLAANFRLIADMNTVGYYPCANYSLKWQLGSLRQYLVTQLMWDPYMSEEEYDGHIKKFMEGYFGEGWEDIYEAFYLWTEKETGCHGFQYGTAFFTDNQIFFQYLRLRRVIEDILAKFNNAMLHAETKEFFENIECNYVQFEFVYVNGVFDNLYKSTDPADNELAQSLSHTLQDRMQKYKVTLADQFAYIPDFDTFTVRPEFWRKVELSDFKGYDLSGNYWTEES